MSKRLRATIELGLMSAGFSLVTACSAPREPEKIGVEADLLKIEKDNPKTKTGAAVAKAAEAKKKRERDEKKGQPE